SVLFVLIAVMGVTLRDLITRRIPDNVASTVISFQAFGALVLSGLALLFIRADTLQPITQLESGYFLGGVIFGVAGYYGIVAAMRAGDASVITPFRYTRLLFSLIVGMLIFHERPDALTLLGAAIILGTGLYTFLRERRLEQAA
ncbi:MAG: DMT family transporter, partial [Amylibacter sp.]